MLPDDMLSFNAVRLAYTIIHRNIAADDISVDALFTSMPSYGRKRLGTCLMHSYGSIDCSADILGYMDSVCSGQRSCRLNVRDLLVYSPCHKDLRGYLEAHYTCVKGIHSINYYTCAYAIKNLILMRKPWRVHPGCCGINERSPACRPNVAMKLPQKTWQRSQKNSLLNDFGQPR
jgi:hypothetical protein